MNYEIELLTPVQIGNGDKYTPLDSVVTNDYFYAIDLDTFYQKLYERRKLQEYLNFIEKKPYLSEYLSGTDIEIEDVKKYRLQLTPQNKKDIDYIKKRTHQFIKNAYGEVYIPGSEIKGSIRTAVLYNLLRNEGNYEYLRQKLQAIKDKGLYGKELGKELEKLSKNMEYHFLCGKKGDPKYDIFKYIEISDSSSLPPEVLQIGHIVSYWSKGKHQYAEILPIGTKFSGNLNIVKRERALTHLGLEGKSDILSKDYILQSLYEHSRDIINHELEFYRKNYNRPTRDFIEQIKRLKCENKEEEPMLQIGQGQGFLSSTISLLVKKRDPHLYDLIRRGTRGRTYPDEFPKTRRFVKENDVPKHRLGWIKFRVLG